MTNILILEDDEIQWGIYRQALPDTEYCCIFKKSPGAAIRWLKQHPTDLLILDLGHGPHNLHGLPEDQTDLDRGATLFRKLRQRFRTKILVVSVYVDTLRGNQVIPTLCADGVLKKPLKPSVLRSSIDTIVRQPSHLAL